MTPVPCSAAQRIVVSRAPCRSDRELRLKRVDVPDRLATVELVDVEVRHAEPAHLAFGGKVGEHAPGLLERRAAFEVGPVDLVEVESLDPEPAQAELALRADDVGAEVAHDAPVRLAPAPALGGDEDVVADPVASQRAPHDFLGVPEPVDRRRVDPVDARLDGVPDAGDRLVVVDRAPTVAPRAADRPRAEPEAGQLRAGRAELPSGVAGRAAARSSRRPRPLVAVPGQVCIGRSGREDGAGILGLHQVTEPLLALRRGGSDPPRSHVWRPGREARGRCPSGGAWSPRLRLSP